MDNSDNSAWVFDSLVGFLHGPIWNIPLQSFIEEKSLPFEPSDFGEVLDRPEYKEIHQEYRNLVDVMLSSFMDDLGITCEQFEAACSMSANDLAGLPAQFHRRLFDQIWAANDYNIFVKMMTHKNVELQLQALELIEKRFGLLPSIYASDTEDLDTSRSEDDWSDKEDVMMELKKLKLNESEELYPADIAPPPVEVITEKLNLRSKLRSFELGESSAKAETTTEADSKPAPKVEKTEPTPLKKVEVSEEEMKARQEYLKQQRDKLLTLKKQVRERKLGENEAAAGSKGGDGEGDAPARHRRPKSAKIAAAALAGKPLPPPDSINLRRALATKLRTEVVDKQ